MQENAPDPVQAGVRECLSQLVESTENSDGATMLAAMERLDEVVRSSRGRLHPQLIHFLENRSYAKALQFLSGDSGIPRGTCQPGRG